MGKKNYATAFPLGYYFNLGERESLLNTFQAFINESSAIKIGGIPRFEKVFLGKENWVNARTFLQNLSLKSNVAILNESRYELSED